MRINSDHSSQPLAENSRSSAAKVPAQNDSASSPRSLGGDQTQLSAAGTQVTALTAQVLQLPEVRQERVQALRQAVQAGTYSPNPGSVAGALLDHLALQPAA